MVLPQGKVRGVLRRLASDIDIGFETGIYRISKAVLKDG
jgi:hypothetical protein